MAQSYRFFGGSTSAGVSFSVFQGRYECAFLYYITGIHTFAC